MRQAHDKPPCARPSGHRKSQSSEEPVIGRASHRKPSYGLQSSSSGGLIRRKSRQGGGRREVGIGFWPGCEDLRGGSLFRGPGLCLGNLCFGGLCLGSFPQSRMQLTLRRGESFLAQRSRFSGRAPLPEGEQATLPRGASRAWGSERSGREEQKRGRACALNRQVTNREYVSTDTFARHA